MTGYENAIPVHIVGISLCDLAKQFKELDSVKVSFVGLHSGKQELGPIAVDVRFYGMPELRNVLEDCERKAHPHPKEK